MKFFPGVFLLCLAVASPLCRGQQIEHSKRNVGSLTEFRWLWGDGDGRRWETWTRLPSRQVGRATSQIGSFDSARISHRVLPALQQRAAEISHAEGIKIGVAGIGNEIRYTTEADSRARAEAVVQSLEAYRQELQSRATRESGYLDLGVSGESRVLVHDYPALVRQYRLVLRPLAESLGRVVGQRDERRLVRYLADFVRSIPYSEAFASGGDLQTPLGMFYENRGDCDTKAVALASLLAGVAPRVRPVFVLVPGHVLLGVRVPVAQGEHTVKYRGARYVLVECAGPGMPPLGFVEEKHLRSITQGDYTVLDSTASAN